MSIATKCTCGYSLTGVCTNSVKECQQLKKENTQLPKEVVLRILKARDALIVGNKDEAYHQLYGIASPKFDKYSPWEEMEKQVGHLRLNEQDIINSKEITAYATKLHQANETIKILKDQVEGLTNAVEELRGMAKRHAVGFAKWVSSSPVTEDDYKSFMMEPKAIDEPTAPLNPELLQVMQDAEKSKEEDLKAVKEGIGEAPSIAQDAHEKEIMMQAFDKVRQIFEGRQWVMDGRGSYPYNDDRYQQEVRYMYDEFDQVVKDTWANIKSKSADYRKAIIAEYLESAAGRDDAVELLRWLNENDWSGVGSGEYINSNNGRILKEEKLYQEFKRREK